MKRSTSGRGGGLRRRRQLGDLDQGGDLHSLSVTQRDSPPVLLGPSAGVEGWRSKSLCPRLAWLTMGMKVPGHCMRQ